MDRNLLDMYPFNLAFDIFKDKDSALNVISSELLLQIKSLEEKEQEVLKLRYSDNLTLNECGKRLGISASRISQIQRKATRKLNHPKVSYNFVAVPKDLLMKEMQKSRELESELFLLKKAMQFETEKGLNMKEVNRIYEVNMLLDSSISDLNISRRSVEALNRTGVRTLGQLIDMSELELRGIRNLGEKSAEEVIKALEENGLRLLRRK